MTGVKAGHLGSRGSLVLCGGGGLFAAALWAVFSAARSWPDWLNSALGSQLFVTHAIVASVAAIGLAALCGVLIRAGRLVRRTRSSVDRGRQDGVAILEFALVLPIALMLSLIMAQSSLLMVGNLCVHYAASCAARSAIVYVPLGATGRSGEGRNTLNPDTKWYKMSKIKAAAVWAVLPVSSSSQNLPEGSAVELVEGIEWLLYMYGQDPPKWVRKDLARKLYYATTYTKVWLDGPENGSEYGDKETLRAHVEHVLYMPIPYANRVFYMLESGDGVKLDAVGPDEYGLKIHASCVLTNEGVRDYIEEEAYPK